MRLHIDSKHFTKKPDGLAIGGIKRRLTDNSSIKDLTVPEIVSALIAGQTIQPGVTPFSNNSRMNGCKGTTDADFSEQTLFMIDLDNEQDDIPKETPESVAKVLGRYGIPIAFAYETFSSTPEKMRFRIGLVSDEPFTNRVERDHVQQSLVKMFSQSDQSCINADRIFFGTNKGLFEGVGNFDAVCEKASLLGFATTVLKTRAEAVPEIAKSKFRQSIPKGKRHKTLVSFASSILKKYGINKYAQEAFLNRATQCEEPLPRKEVDRIWSDACAYYNRNISMKPDYVSPEEYEAQDSFNTYEPNDYTDVGQSTIFAKIYGNRVKYTSATRFIVYDDAVWRESEIKAQGLSQELTQFQLEEARKRVRMAQDKLNIAVESGNKDEINVAKINLALQEKYRKHALERRRTDKVKATLTEARPLVEIHTDQLDADGYLLNTPSGTVDLHTGIMKPHTPNDFCTKITAVTPDSVNADKFESFMEMLTVGDKSLENYLQDIAGMCAIGHVLRENLIIAYGEGGNGKSTFFNLLARVLGDYSGLLSAEILTANCRKNKSPEQAELRGKRLVIAAELEEGMRLDTAVLKKLCSTDPIEAEKKYKDPFKFIPSHTLILYTNHLPKIGTNDNGTWQRIIVIPFLASFRGMKGEIKNYADYLFDHCGGAVLAWMIEGAKRLIANDYNIAMPDCVKEAIEQYRANNDWLEPFLAECCEVDRRYEQKSGDMYTCYREYCDDTGEYKRSRADFVKALASAGYKSRKTKKGAIIQGLRVMPIFAHVNVPSQ